MQLSRIFLSGIIIFGVFCQSFAMQQEEARTLKLEIISGNTGKSQELPIGLALEDCLYVPQRYLLEGFNEDSLQDARSYKEEKLREFALLYRSINNAICSNTILSWKDLMNPQDKDLYSYPSSTIRLLERITRDNSSNENDESFLQKKDAQVSLAFDLDFLQRPGTQKLAIKVPKYFDDMHKVALLKVFHNLLNPISIVTKPGVKNEGRGFRDDEIGCKLFSVTQTVNVLKGLNKLVESHENQKSKEDVTEDTPIWEPVQKTYSFKKSALFLFASLASYAGFSYFDQNVKSLCQKIFKTDKVATFGKWSMTGGLGAASLYEFLGACGLLKK